MSIHLKKGVIALIGNEIKEKSIVDIAHTIDLYIQYGNSSSQPIQIQIEKDCWTENSEEQYYIELLYRQEKYHNAIIYDSNNDKKIIL